MTRRPSVLPAGTALLAIRRVASRALPGAYLLRPNLVAILAAEHEAEAIDWAAIAALSEVELARAVERIVRRHASRRAVRDAAE